VRDRLWLGEGPGGLLPHDRSAEPAGANEGDRPSVPATLWLALLAARSARTLRELDTARTLLLWCAARAGGTGLLPERLPSGEAALEAQAPVMLAHAWFVRAAVEYEERYRWIQRCDRCGAPARARRAAPELAEGALPGIVAHQ
jgi:hypothetical protein